VGVLKEWLVRALTGVSRRNAICSDDARLQTHALSVVTVRKNAVGDFGRRGRTSEDVEQSNRLRTRLGLSLHEEHSEKVICPIVTIEMPSTRKQHGRLGQRCIRVMLSDESVQMPATV